MSMKAIRERILNVRINDASDTYAGEFALVDGDAHYKTNHLGSYYKLTDTE